MAKELEGQEKGSPSIPRASAAPKTTSTRLRKMLNEFMEHSGSTSSSFVSSSTPSTKLSHVGIETR
jgi:hypothetical protein